MVRKTAVNLKTKHNDCTDLLNNMWFFSSTNRGFTLDRPQRIEVQIELTTTSKSKQSKFRISIQMECFIMLSTISLKTTRISKISSAEIKIGCIRFVMDIWFKLDLLLFPSIYLHFSFKRLSKSKPKANQTRYIRIVFQAYVCHETWISSIIYENKENSNRYVKLMRIQWLAGFTKQTYIPIPFEIQA